jgi:adenylate cyclase
MALEIERKFLLLDERWRSQVNTSVIMRQGYLGGDGVSVRVRIAGEQAWLNIKQARLGASRLEFEYPVPLHDAEELMALCRDGCIDKTRHYIAQDGFTWEIDEFHGANEGLLVAEIELDAVGQAFARPAWLGAEVTGQERYYNVALAQQPFSTWSSK